MFYRVKKDQVVDVAEIKEMVENVKEFVGEKRHYAIIDFGSNLGSTTEARKVYAEDPHILKYRIADAFLVRSLSVGLIANFFIKVTRPKITKRLFTNENEAVKWLESIKQSAVQHNGKIKNPALVLPGQGLKNKFCKDYFFLE